MKIQVGDLDPVMVRRELLDYYLRHSFESTEELLEFIEAFWKLRVPRANVCPEHTPPSQYIIDSFFERVQDSVCWANRGGGKTLLGALATWLDTVFKSECATKILGGSLEQSKKMYQHLTGEGDGWGLVTEDFQYLIEGEMLAAKTATLNGSNINILTASMKSVRGPHPQKLKLDEVDECDDRIYEAALLIPKTKRGIRASTQIYSTMHKAYGLMNRVIEEAALSGYKIYKWCVFDVMEKCPEWRECGTCELWEDCQGKARHADGFYSIEDAISEKRKVSRDTWLSEMLCHKPSQEGLIYKEFDINVHVVSDPFEHEPEGAG
ncbi:MAG: hypothetical protein PHX53_09735 [Syntrophales bacterium]|nr:hypothetical protein [Syntrophales bacterium]